MPTALRLGKLKSIASRACHPESHGNVRPMVISPEIVRDYIEQLADQIQDWIRRKPVDVTV
jgi:hypothetical protein